MQDLEKRMRETTKLSTSWEEIKNEEDLLMANTFYNAKKPEILTASTKKNPKKKVTWD